MALENIHTYLVYPNKGLDEPHAIGGTEVPLNGKVFELIRDIYQNADRDCTIDISFNQGPDGEAVNPCRSLALGYLERPSVEAGRAIGERLSSFTTKRSGLGLLFVARGQEGRERKIILARFPAHSGILAEEGARALTVAFLERVFMRNAKTYKAAVYQDVSVATGFWTGRVIDRQIDSREVEVSQYWVNEFLDSDFRTTSAAGTRRLALAMRGAARKATELVVKREIAAAVTLAGGLAGQTLTASQFAERFGLSERATEQIIKEMPHPGLINERFRFDAQEFARQVPYRSVELDSGAILTADASNFDEVFDQEPVGEGGQTRFSTTGRVVTEKLEKIR